ncbi:MAG: ChaN family lipoprotein [Burkholderiaceae bacterium]
MRFLALALALSLSACAGRGPVAAQITTEGLLLIGEQHDAREHQQIQARVVGDLARSGRLAALLIEMADAGHHARGLPRDASEAAVREALRWSDAGWPWDAYGPVVMVAVRAGVPVLGANLPRGQMRGAMADASLDARLDAVALEAQRSAVRDGHCGLLPESQIAPMTRIQIARDVQMASMLQSALTPGQVVVLVAGGGHVRRDIGVPRHLGTTPGPTARVLWLQAGDAAPPAALQAQDEVRRTPALPARDYCAELRERFKPKPAPAP